MRGIIRRAGGTKKSMMTFPHDFSIFDGEMEGMDSGQSRQEGGFDGVRACTFVSRRRSYRLNAKWNTKAYHHETHNPKGPAHLQGHGIVRI